LKLFLDACFLTYLNTCIQGDRASLDDLFKRILTEELYTNLLAVDETLYISMKKYKVPYEVTMSFFKDIILPHTQVIALDESDIENLKTYLEKYSIKPSDALHLSSMEKKGIRSIVTEDKVFEKVEEIQRVWL